MNKKIFMIAMLVFISLASINLIQSKVFIDQPQVIVQVFSGTETTYLALTDTENTYVGQAGLCVIVNTSEGGLTFGACGSGAGDVVNGSQGYVLNFTNIFSDDWTNVTITQSQISDFSPITDTNETLRFENLTDVSCAGNDKVIGVFANGTIQCATDVTGAGGKGTSSDYLFNDSANIFFNDSFQNNTLDTRYIQNEAIGIILNFTNIFSLDWSNISGLTQSQFENSTFHYNQTVLDTNETVRFENLTDVSCAGNDKVVGVFANGTIQCATDQDSGAALTNPFDQELNITSNVTFNAVNSTNWLNVSITESQISNLQTYTINDTLDWVLNFSSIFSKDWSNISDLIDAQINDDLTISGGIIGSNSISGTLTTTGTLTIGDGGDQIDIDSDSWDVTNGVVTGASIVASQITTGTFGTGNYVMDTNLTVQDLVMEANLSQRISSNVTCMILYGVTTTLELC